MEARDHERISEALGAYVLGALDPKERKEVEGHVGTCPTCQEEVTGLEEAVSILHSRFRSPPAELWTRITSRLRETPNAS